MSRQGETVIAPAFEINLVPSPSRAITQSPVHTHSPPVCTPILIEYWPRTDSGCLHEYQECFPSFRESPAACFRVGLDVSSHYTNQPELSIDYRWCFSAATSLPSGSGERVHSYQVTSSETTPKISVLIVRKIDGVRPLHTNPYSVC